MGALGGNECTDILPGRIPLTGQANAEAFLNVLSLVNWEITLTTRLTAQVSGTAFVEKTAVIKFPGINDFFCPQIKGVT